MTAPESTPQMAVPNAEAIARAPIQHEAAYNAARRLINSHFNNPGQQAITRIPAQLDDDDILILQYIREQEAAAAINDAAAIQRGDGQTDTKRLNWLISHSAYLSHSRDGEVCNVWFRYDPNDDSGDSVPALGYPQKCFGDAREAIDAAMKGNQ